MNYPAAGSGNTCLPLADQILVRRVYGGLVCLLPASGWFTSLWLVYQPFTSLWLVGWLAGWRILSAFYQPLDGWRIKKLEPGNSLLL